MTKSLILFLAALSLIFCVPRIRQTLNFNEEKLTQCLKDKANLEYNEQVEELRAYHDTLRNYLFSKKYEEYKFNTTIKEDMIYCFDNYGEKAPRVSPGLNCMDRCHDETPGQVCRCPRY